MCRWMRKFRQGQADYVTMRPRPAEPSEAEMRRPASARYFGWMIARAHDVQKVIDDLQRFGAEQRADYDFILNRRVDLIDRAHGLLPKNVSRLH